MKNEMHIRFLSLSQNEAFARVAVGAFASQMNATLSDIADIKTAVSEAVTNAIIHGYNEGSGVVEVSCFIDGLKIEVRVKDFGAGISDVLEARKPFYTTKPELDRSGMGFTVMETFMDEVIVESKEGSGTTVRMIKKIKGIEGDS